jgi:hypothetical protein
VVGAPPNKKAKAFYHIIFIGMGYRQIWKIPSKRYFAFERLSLYLF